MLLSLWAQQLTRPPRLLASICTATKPLCKQKSGSSKRWLNRQKNDYWANQAKASDYRSRAAFKLKQLNDQYRLFRPGMTVVDLGFAPGSWSQVALELTKPNGRVIGVDMLPVEPPMGVSAIQGNFLADEVQDQLRHVLQDQNAGRKSPGAKAFLSDEEIKDHIAEQSKREQQLAKSISEQEQPEHESQTVDVVLSDMCDIWPQTQGFGIANINNTYDRLQNTSGLIARDHAHSIDLCDAALLFAIECLRPGGSFVCKFYTGEEDSQLESRLKRVFKTVRRVKPTASRQESREMYFVGLNKRRLLKSRL